MRPVMEQPSGQTLRAFRMSIVIDGKTCSAGQFGVPLGLSEQRINDYENEKRGVLMPAPLWLFARITWDSLALAQWLKKRPRRE